MSDPRREHPEPTSDGAPLEFAFGIRYLHAASPALIHSPGLEWLVLTAAVGLLISARVMGKALLSLALATRSFRLLQRIPISQLRR